MGTLTVTEPFSLSGTGVGNGAIWIPSTSGATTLSGVITTTASSRINTDIASGTGTLTISGGVANTTGLTLGGVGDVTINSVISGATAATSNLIKDGAGKLILSSANTYAGTTTITAGIVQIQNSNALGTNTGSLGTSIAASAALEINGATAIPEAITINGTGISNTGAIRLITGASAATLSGAMTVAAASRINTDIASGTNTLTISGAIANNAGLTLGGIGDFSISGIISGSSTANSNLTKDGAGKLLLSGVNTYAGTTSITAGVVQLRSTDALGTFASSQGTTIADGTAIEINATTAITIPEAITLNGTGVSNTGAIRLLSTSTSTPTLSGTITAASATRINTDVSSATSTLTITGGITNTAGITFGTTSTGNIAVSGIISGSDASNSNIIKEGSAGKLLLSGVNTYAGTTSITAGVIQVANNNALGAAGSVGTIVGTGAALEINGSSTALTIPEAITINGTGLSNGGAIRLVSGAQAATLSGTITVASASRINTDISTGTSTLTISGNITNDAGLTFGTISNGNISVSGNISGSSSSNSNITKDGHATTGILILSGANTYAGTTSVTAGVIQIASNDALGTLSGSQGTIVGNGAAVEISGASALTIPEAFNLNGTGITNAGAIRLIGTSAAATLTGGLTATTASRINTNATSATSTLTISTIGITNTAGITFGVTSAGSINVASAISGSNTATSNIIKDGTGTGKLILSTSNSYAGTTTVTAGTLQITNNEALGTNTQATTVSDGATLELNGISTLTEPLNLNGLGVSSLGALRILSTNPAATLSGLITAQTATRINTDITSGTNTLTISGGITNTNGLTLGSIGDVSINSVISGSGNLVKDGAGKLLLSTANTYAGTTSITSGIVQISNADALGSVSAGGAGQSTTTVGSGAAIEINGTAALTIPEAISINGTGVSNTGAIRLLSTSSAATLSGALTVPTASRINTDITSGTNTLTISGGITANASLTFGNASDGGITVSSIIGGI